jgi:transposase
MAKAYSGDLRRKVLEAHAAGEGTLEELAERFDVSVGWVFKISAALAKTGKMERQPGAKRGRVSKVTPEIESFIKEVIQGRSDTTLAELQWKLFEEEQQLEISVGRLWQVVDQLDLRFKKKSARRRTRHPPNPRATSKLAGDGR